MSATLNKILTDEGLRQKLFPVTQQEIFLAHAGVSPLPHTAYEAIEQEARAASTHQQQTHYLEQLNQGRKIAAELFDVASEEVALLGPTSLGLSLVANGLEWKPGDEVIFYPDDYPANVYPWLNLERLGVKLVPLYPEKIGIITPELVARHITPRCKLIALASTHFLSGHCIDVDTIGDLAHQNGAFFSLDAIQSLGAFNLSLKNVDFISADSHKWMLGPLAAGIFIVKKEMWECLRPSLLGAENVQTRHYIAASHIEFVSGAARYEPGAMNLLGIVGMTASLQLLAQMEIKSITQHLHQLKQLLLHPLQENGFEFLHPDPLSCSSGILTFRHSRFETRTLFSYLNENRVTASLRRTRDGQDWIRFSPHFYTTPLEIQKTLEIIRSFIRHSPSALRPID